MINTTLCLIVRFYTASKTYKVKTFWRYKTHPWKKLEMCYFPHLFLIETAFFVSHYARIAKTAALRNTSVAPGSVLPHEQVSLRKWHLESPETSPLNVITGFLTLPGGISCHQPSQLCDFSFVILRISESSTVSLKCRLVFICLDNFSAPTKTPRRKPLLWNIHQFMSLPYPFITGFGPRRPVTNLLPVHTGPRVGLGWAGLAGWLEKGWGWHLGSGWLG